MFIPTKEHTRRCKSCGAPVSAVDNDSFCHKCGEFLTSQTTRWVDNVNKESGQFSYASLDLNKEPKEE